MVSKSTFTLVTRSEPLIKPSLFDALAIHRDGQADKRVIVPERVLFEAYSTLLGEMATEQLLCQEIQSSQLMCDDFLSEYPVLTHESLLVRKENIAPFLRQITSIDHKFSQEVSSDENADAKLRYERETISRLTMLVQTQLHLVTRYNFYEEEIKYRNVLKWFWAPFRELQNWRDLSVVKQRTEALFDICLTSSTSRFNAAKRVHDELERSLCEEDFASDGEGKRTFFDTALKEESKQVVVEEEKEVLVTEGGSDKNILNVSSTEWADTLSKENIHNLSSTDWAHTLSKEIDKVATPTKLREKADGARPPESDEDEAPARSHKRPDGAKPQDREEATQIRQEETQNKQAESPKEADDPILDIEESLKMNPDLRLSSLDLVVYAYLKEEMVNTPESAETKYLFANCPKLVKFVQIMDFLLQSTSTESEIIESNKVALKVIDRGQIVNSFVQRDEYAESQGMLSSVLVWPIRTPMLHLIEGRGPLAYSWLDFIDPDAYEVDADKQESLGQAKFEKMQREEITKQHDQLHRQTILLATSVFFLLNFNSAFS